MVAAEAVVAMPETKDLLWFRKLGFDVNFRACMSQSCIMFILVSWLTKVVNNKNSEMKHIHVYYCLMNPKQEGC